MKALLGLIVLGFVSGIALADMEPGTIAQVVRNGGMGKSPKQGVRVSASGKVEKLEGKWRSEQWREIGSLPAEEAARLAQWIQAIDKKSLEPIVPANRKSDRPETCYEIRNAKGETILIERTGGSRPDERIMVNQVEEIAHLLDAIRSSGQIR